MNKWAAGGKRIGSGASGRGDDKTVGAIAAHEIGVDGEANFDHAGEGAFVDNDFVEDALIVKRFAVANHRRVEHDAFAGGEMAGEGFFERRVEFLQRETGEEAEAAEVDGQNWNATGSGFASCG